MNMGPPFLPAGRQAPEILHSVQDDARGE